MKRSERLEKINTINRGIENLAGASFAASQNEYETKLNQLKQLKIYRDEYQQKLRSRMETPISAREMRDYHFFFNSLEDAINQQEDVVQQFEVEMEKDKQSWMEKRQEVKKMDLATSSIQRKELQARENQELKESDERNQHHFSKSYSH